MGKSAGGVVVTATVKGLPVASVTVTTEEVQGM
jgi:hypothetical protein